MKISFVECSPENALPPETAKQMLLERRASSLPFLRKPHAPDSESAPLWIRFLSFRAMEPLLTLRSVQNLLNGDPSQSVETQQQSLRALGLLVGPYAVTDSLAARLRSLGLRPGANGEIPYTALVDFVDEARLLLMNQPVWTVNQVREYCEGLGIEPKAWQCPPGLAASIKVIESAQVNKHNFWTFLEAFDCLESHRNLFFCLGFDAH